MKCQSSDALQLPSPAAMRPCNNIPSMVVLNSALEPAGPMVRKLIAPIKGVKKYWMRWLWYWTQAPRLWVLVGNWFEIGSDSPFNSGLSGRIRIFSHPCSFMNYFLLPICLLFRDCLILFFSLRLQWEQSIVQVLDNFTAASGVHCGTILASNNLSTDSKSKRQQSIPWSRNRYVWHIVRNRLESIFSASAVTENTQFTLILCLHWNINTEQE